MTKKKITHIHHIIPQHMGGTDDPENLIELTIEEHADAHRVLYEQYGNEKDYVAWKALSGQIDKAEANRLLSIEGGKKSGEIHKKRLKDDAEYRKRHHKLIKKAAKKGGIAFHKKYPGRLNEISQQPEVQEKRNKTFKKIKHQQGEKNSQYGTRWIYSLEEKRNKKIKKDDDLPNSWFEGRKMKF